MSVSQPFGLSAQGWKSKRLADIVENLDNAFVAQFGDINTQPQSVFGQIIGVSAKDYADIWENMNFVYASQYPNSAFGTSLDNVVALNGLTRLPQTQTSVFASATGDEGTLIPGNALARIPNTGDVFFAPIGTIISQSNADFARVAVGTLAGQIYTINLNAVPFIFSLPIITFTGSFVTGNMTTIFINNIALATVPFNTSSSQTITDIATQIATDPAVLSATPSGSTIKIVPNVGFSVTVNAITIAGGASQPTSAITFDVPSGTNQVSQYLTAVINVGTPSWTAVDLTGSLTITTNNGNQPFSIALGLNLSLTSFTSPILFLSQQFGPIPCPQNSLTEIITPIGGWLDLNNNVAGTLGTFTETDAQLRLRRQNSIKLFGLATVEAIRAHLINVPNVTAATVFENVTLTETSMVITFSGALIAGQTINVTYNGTQTLTPVPFSVSMATTMATLATEFLTIPGVSTAVVSGGDLILTVTFQNLFEVVIVTGDVTVTGTGTLPTAIVAGGQPPKSIQAVVQGGSNTDIGNEIWRTKPAGIETFGNTSVNILDSQGVTHTMNFSRPIPIYIWITAVLTLNPQETFPPTGDQLVAQAILTYGNSLGVGIDVFQQRVLSQIFQIPGIASAVLTMAATTTPTGAPTFSASDILVDNTQISAWDIQRIAVTV